jgi:hypothetical protein
MDRTEDDGSVMDEGEGDGAGMIREVAPVSRFDPTPYLRQLRGRGVSGEYLDVKWRLLWLRTEHPDARIETEHIQIEPTLAIFKATVTIPTGGMATGYGSETPGDFGDYIEKAETKAIGRALNALGYGAQFREPGDEDAPGTANGGRGGQSNQPPRIQRTTWQPERAAPAPRDVQPAPAPLDRPVAQAAAPAPTTEPSPDPNPDPEPPAQRPVSLNTGRARASAPAAPAAPAGETADDSPFTWAAFREWVAGQGLNTREEINQLLGRDTTGMSPVELRDAIIAARA